MAGLLLATVLALLLCALAAGGTGTSHRPGETLMNNLWTPRLGGLA